MRTLKILDQEMLDLPFKRAEVVKMEDKNIFGPKDRDLKLGSKDQDMGPTYKIRETHIYVSLVLE